MLQIGKQRAEQRGAEQEARHQLPHDRRLAHPQQRFAEQAADQQQHHELSHKHCFGGPAAALGRQSDRRGHRQQDCGRGGGRQPSGDVPYRAACVCHGRSKSRFFGVRRGKCRITGRSSPGSIRKMQLQIIRNKPNLVSTETESGS